MEVKINADRLHWIIKPKSGFTLVELMLTILISAVIMGAIYTVYTIQQRTATAQEQENEMQQNIRAALTLITKGVRMAGYNPLRTANTGFITAQTGQLSFSHDLTDLAGTATDGDGAAIVLNGAGVPVSGAGPGEVLDFGFSVADDADRNGVPDAVDANGVPVATSLGRQSNGAGGYQAIAENIQAIEFRYLDSSGLVTATLADIRSIQVSILARTGRTDPAYINNVTYTPASGVPWDLNGAAAGNAANDNFRRLLFITTIRCRNMGLE